MSKRLITVSVKQAQDVALARGRARQVAALMGFDPLDQTRIATAVSELARNAFLHARGGEVAFAIEQQGAQQSICVRISDRGPGIADLAAVLDGRTPGLGIASSRRLVDSLEICSVPGEGTQATLGKALPPAAAPITGERMGAIAAELAGHPIDGPLAEIRQQDREIARVLDELRGRQETIAQLSRELEETNRGVVALYAELDERADQLHRADEMKTRFFSSMSHELRTPLNSIRALSRLLLDRVDGPLNDEQVRQVTFIRTATNDLTQIVDDLLDLAKIAAGKSEVHCSSFAMTDMFGVLRGMLRPLLANERVTLRFDDASSIPPLVSDEAKVSQILRNLVSNALKYTEQGEVRVGASFNEHDRTVCIRVSDTGIGIAAADQERIFDEFTQIANPLQARVKGTGLGLPLCRRLATVLGGSVRVESTPGSGSTFILTLPLRLDETAPSVPGAKSHGTHRSGQSASLEHLQPATLVSVLVVDDDPAARYAIGRLLDPTRYRITEAPNGAEGLRAAAAIRPALVVLDLQLTDTDGEQVLRHLRAAEATRGVPVVIVTSKPLDERERSNLERLNAVVYSKRALDDPGLGRALQEAIERNPVLAPSS